MLEARRTARLRRVKLVGLAALLTAGVLVAGVAASVGGAQTTETTTETVQETTTETVTEATATTVHETTTVQQTTTAPATTVVTTATVVPTTTATATTPTATTSTTSTSSGTPTWVWIVLALLAAAVIGLLAVLLTRRGTAAIPDNERWRRLQSAIESWTVQGWAVLSQTPDSAMLQRGSERMTVSVDPAGQISTQLLTTQQSAWPGGVDPNAPTERIDPNDPNGSRPGT